MSARSYLVGLPVGIDVADDGTVTIHVYLEEAADLEISDDDEISREDMIADSLRISAAYEAGEIRVERSKGTT